MCVGGGGQLEPPSTFDTIHPIDMIFGTYNKLHLYFQLSGVSLVTMATRVT